MLVRARFTLRVTTALLATAALLTISAPRTASAQGIDPGAKVLAQLDDAWSKAAGGRDVEKVASFYAEDAVAYPPGEPVAVGRAAAKKIWAAYLSDPSGSMSWKTTRAAIARSGDIGFTSGTYESVYQGTDGKPAKEIGKFLCVWKKQKDGSWKAIQDMWNADGR